MFVGTYILIKQLHGPKEKCTEQIVGLLVKTLKFYFIIKQKKLLVLIIHNMAPFTS